MALPKRKFSRGRRDKRRANWKLTVKSLTKCTQCGKSLIPHRVCTFCGFYRGRQIVLIAAKKTGEKP